MTDRHRDADNEGEQPAEEDEGALGEEVFDNLCEKLASQRAKHGQDHQIDAEKLSEEDGEFHRCLPC